ncbi:unnamed protein product [Rotaria sordida]|uniref:Uncharacterized protein n=1 Tax=Rotaria sordida TaxID=392033 RepID=A0A819YRF0_9BILA|nr:unnamed protein product [Rotaria sordida]
MNPSLRRNQDEKISEDNSHKISRIFHWSCLEFKGNRFSLVESGKEMLETIMDVSLHSIGFFLAFRMIESIWYKIAVLSLMFGLLYRQMLSLKYFFTEPKMMPPQLQRLFTIISPSSVAD